MCPYTNIFLTLLFVYHQFLLAGGVCYFPDQSITWEPYVPCDIASGVYSACCDVGDQCTSNGYCYGSARYFYRGGCTDITWHSPNCAPQCKHAAIHSFSNIYPCPLNNGSYTINWCCGADESSPEAKTGCCNGELLTPEFGFVYMASSSISMLASSSSYTIASPSSGVGQTADPNPSTVASSSSYTATYPSSITSWTSTKPSQSTMKPASTPVEPSSGPAQPSHEGLAVGTGVGVSMAGILLFGLVFLLLRERRRRIHALKMADDAYTAADERARRERQITTVRDCESRDHQLPQELEHVQQGPKEIYSQEVYETNGDL